MLELIMVESFISSLSAICIGVSLSIGGTNFRNFTDMDGLKKQTF